MGIRAGSSQKKFCGDIVLHGSYLVPRKVRNVCQYVSGWPKPRQRISENSREFTNTWGTQGGDRTNEQALSTESLE